MTEFLRFWQERFAATAKSPAATQFAGQAKEVYQRLGETQGQLFPNGCGGNYAKCVPAIPSESPLFKSAPRDRDGSTDVAARSKNE